MRLTNHVYMVGGGIAGFGISNPHDSNVYLVTDGVSGLLIDAGLGPGTKQIVSNIENDGIDPACIDRVVITHAHADHAGACAALKRTLGVDVCVPQGTKQWMEVADEEAIDLTRAKKAGLYYPEYKLEPVSVDCELSDGDFIQVGSLMLEAIWTPGHTAKHLCFVLRSEGSILAFTGDFVFWQGHILQISTPDASLPDYLASMERFRGFGIDGLVPGHGAITISDGQAHVDKALSAFDRLGIPPNFGS